MKDCPFRIGVLPPEHIKLDENYYHCRKEKCEWWIQNGCAIAWMGGWCADDDRYSKNESNEVNIDISNEEMPF
jgi:hypothetical protein